MKPPAEPFVSVEVVKAIAVTSELLGTELTPAAARVFAEDLGRYPERLVLAALTRCRREVKGRLTIADVISRIDDGRPGVEEAWSLLPRSEAESAAMTTEMMAGFALAAPLLAEGDTVAARMAFKEAYNAAVQRARDDGDPVKWMPSLGHGKAGRDDARQEAERRNAIAEGRPMLRLERQDEPFRLEHLELCALESPPSDPAKAAEVIANLRAMLGRKA